MNLHELKKALPAPVYPQAKLVIVYANEIYGYEIETNHPDLGPVKVTSTWCFQVTDQEAILEAKRELRKRVHRLSRESDYPKAIMVDVTESGEPVRVPWYRRIFAARS